MKTPPSGMTQIEWLESIIPQGDGCWGCGNIENGKCTTWGQQVDANSKKCEWCLRNEYLGKVRRLKKECDP